MLRANAKVAVGLLAQELAIACKLVRTVVSINNIVKKGPAFQDVMEMK